MLSLNKNLTDPKSLTLNWDWKRVVMNKKNQTFWRDLKKKNERTRKKELTGGKWVGFVFGEGEMMGWEITTRWGGRRREGDESNLCHHYLLLVLSVSTRWYFWLGATELAGEHV